MLVTFLKTSLKEILAMLLPTKHLTENRSLIGIGAIVLDLLNEPRTISNLWNGVRGKLMGARISYERFILCLDFLFMIDAIVFHDGFLKKKND